MITLEQLLESRDRRAQHQQELLQAFPGCSLVCLTVQPPGPVKRSRESLLTGGAGLSALLDKFGSVLRHAQVRDLVTGYEAYLLVALPPRLTKQLCVDIEDRHPLGRLMDLDVVFAPSPVVGESTEMPHSVDTKAQTPGVSTNTAVIVDRAALGLPERRCLLCGQPARYCMRARTHTTAQLLEKIHQMVEDYMNM